MPFQHESLDGVPYVVSRLGDPAGFWIRFIALILDIAIVFGIGAVLWPLLFGETFWVKEITVTPVTEDGTARITSTTWRTQNWHVVMWLLYSIIFHARYGATPAKMLFRIRVYDRSGRRGIGFLRATVRMFSTWISFFTILIGFIMAGFRSDKRSMHDLIAATYPTRIR